jgi:hypothetical protein
MGNVPGRPGISCLASKGGLSLPLKAGAVSFAMRIYWDRRIAKVQSGSCQLRHFTLPQLWPQLAPELGPFLSKGLSVRRLWTFVRPRARFINLGEKIGGFLDQGSRKLSVVCGSCELNKRRRLTQEILPAYHDIFPARLRSAKLESRDFVPAKPYRSGVKEKTLTGKSRNVPTVVKTANSVKAKLGLRNST